MSTKTPKSKGGKAKPSPPSVGQKSILSFFNKAAGPPPSAPPPSSQEEETVSRSLSSTLSEIPVSEKSNGNVKDKQSKREKDVDSMEVEDADDSKKQSTSTPGKRNRTAQEEEMSASKKAKPEKPRIQAKNVLAVGTTLRVRWKETDSWYEGEVKAFDGRKHLLEFDDGSFPDWYNLDKETFEVISPPSKSDSDEKENQPSRSERLRPRPQRKARSTRKMIVESSDEEREDEEEEEAERKSGKEETSSTANCKVIQEEDGDSDEKEWAPEPPAKSKSSSSARRPTFASPPKPQRSSSSTSSLPPTPKMSPSPSSSSGATGIFRSSSQTLKTPVTKSPSSRSSPSMSPSPSQAAPLISEQMQESGVFGEGQHEHDELEWLHQDRRDINRNRPGDPDYDDRTLFVPPQALAKETPAMQQWWKFKQQNMDTVCFFKVGKFYEMFHMDADVGYRELGLIYMKGKKAHSGFPEIAFGKFANNLISRGYRVARVEQTETPEMMKDRNAQNKGVKSAPGDKTKRVVKREMCSMLSKGTRTRDVLEFSVDGAPQLEDSSSLLLIIKEEKGRENVGEEEWQYGVCVVDCTTGHFQLGQFSDNAQRERLYTLLSMVRPAEAVIEKYQCSEECLQMLRLCSPSLLLVPLFSLKEFWDKERTIEELNEAHYWDDGEWPAALQTLREREDEFSLAFSAFGASIWHLRRCLIDHELISLKNFSLYSPPGSATSPLSSGSLSSSSDLTVLSEEREEEREDVREGEHMVLDGHTISNLELLANSYDGKRKGSLLAFLDHTVSAFGRRILEGWLLKPLRRVRDINYRLDAVEELMGLGEEMTNFRTELKKLPDLERLLSRIHAFGSKHRAEEHPNSRAIMYEEKEYNIRKIKDFMSALDGFKAADTLIRRFSEGGYSFSSPLLRSLLTMAPSGALKKGKACYPDLLELMKYFDGAFDRKRAREEGVIFPYEGADPDYDEAKREETEIKRELNEYLQKMRKEFHCAEIQYWGTKKEERFQLELPERVYKKGLPAEFETISRKKGYTRFHTPMIKRLLKDLIAAEEQVAACLKDQMRKVFHKFAENYASWMMAVKCLGTLDALMSLALVSNNTENMCRPTFALPPPGSGPFLDLRGGRHPCVQENIEGGSFIPNDTRLGHAGERERDGETEDQALCNEKGAPMLLLTGPNMGGKSTLLRQTCVIVILAQMGCFVPAEYCHLSPVDRVFTRIGASDRILAGQSTFFVELSETANILHHATDKSLVILDELGRGTSTFDGTAIAYAVIEHLSKVVGCRTLVATHYHSLVEEYKEDHNVALGHMDCLVDPESNNQRVTFLYKLVDGACPKSYGINVARLARLPEKVIREAQRRSEIFEESLRTAHRKAMTGGSSPSPSSSSQELSLFQRLEAAVENGDVEAIKALQREASQLFSSS